MSDTENDSQPKAGEETEVAIVAWQVLCPYCHRKFTQPMLTYPEWASVVNEPPKARPDCL